jgi:hypothetical protein
MHKNAYTFTQIDLNHFNYGVRLCAVCSMRWAVCGCPEFKFMQCAAVCGKPHGCVQQCSSVRGSVRLSGSVRSSVWLSSGVAVCGSPAVSIFSNKFKIYYVFV